MSEILTVHGVVARVIDVPSQGITYLRIECPIEYHAELTRQLYGKPVLVMPAGDAMRGAPYGPMIAGAPPATPRPTIQAAPSPTLPKGGKLSKDAATICAQPEFIRYAWKMQTGDTGAPDEGFGPDDAAQYMREFCGVPSRALLDHDVAARASFAALMRDFNAGLNASPAAAE